MTTQAFVWSGTPSQFADANTAYTLGLRFELLTGNSLPCVGIRMRMADTLTDPTNDLTLGLWQVSDSSLVATGTHSPQPGDAGVDVDMLFDTPFTLLDGASEEYIVGVQIGQTGVGGTVRYAAITSYSVPVIQDPLFIGLAGFRFAVGNSLTIPNSGTTTNFLVSPIVDLGGAVEEPVNTATETDTAIALGRTKARLVGQTSETDSSISLGRAKTKALVRTDETDTAVTFGRIKSRTLGMAAETSSAFSLGKAKVRALARADETDTARPLGGATVAVGAGSPITSSTPDIRYTSQTIGGRL